MTGRVPRALLAALALAAPGCAYLGWGFTCPARGGAAWRELQTPSFTIRTNAPEGEARELAIQMERIHEAVNAALALDPPPPAGPRIRVVAFRSKTEFAAFAPRDAAAYHGRSLMNEPVIVLASWVRARVKRGSADHVHRIVAHELAHHELALVMRRQPRWFAEGMATRVDRAGMSEDWVRQGVVERKAKVRKILTPDTLAWTLTAPPGVSAIDYTLAWSVVHLLSARYPDAFRALQGRFAAGEEPLDAWRATFPRWDPASPAGMRALEAELRAHIEGDEVADRPVPLGPTPAVGERLLSSSEVHATRLELTRYAREGLERVTAPAVLDEELRKEVDEALGEDPGNLLALMRRAELEPGEAPALARRAAEANPADPRAWLFLSWTIQDDPAAREAALRRALDARPDHPATLVELTRLLLETGRAAEAVEVAARASALAPWHPQVGIVHARALAAAGRCPEALAARRRALDVAGVGEAGGAREALRALAPIDETCPAPSTSLPGAP
ncbi:MAG: hypothetical protein QM704_10780 [Anaeromyxobacteraceae bacterium]